MKVLGVHHIVLAVDQLESPAATWKQVFGFEAEPTIHPLGMQMEIRKHGRVSVKPRDVGIECFGAIDAHQSPAAAELQHACPRIDAAPLEIVHQHKTGSPDLLAMERGLYRFLL